MSGGLTVKDLSSRNIRAQFEFKISTGRIHKQFSDTEMFFLANGPFRTISLDFAATARILASWPFSGHEW